MSLAQSILTLLKKEKQGLSAKNIAKILNLEKSEVNKILYEMADEEKVRVNDHFEWQARNKEKATWEISKISEQKTTEVAVEVYFNPETNCQSIVCNYVALAKDSIYIQIFLLNFERVTTSIKEAAARGVKVMIIVDDEKGDHAAKNFSTVENVTLAIDDLAGNNHNKTVVIDSRIVLHGSVNFNSAPYYNKNRETLIVLHSDTVAAQFIHNWNHNHKNIKKHTVREV